MHGTFFAVGVFALASFFGPFVRLLTPYSKFDGSVSDRISQFGYDLVLLLWPAQPIAVMEASVGKLFAVAMALSANILLFTIIGFFAGISAKRSVWLGANYVIVCGLVLLVALWGTGYSLAHLNWVALITAFAFYAIPFWVVRRRSIV